jgi:hypothetical protein
MMDTHTREGREKYRGASEKLPCCERDWRHGNALRVQDRDVYRANANLED